MALKNTYTKTPVATMLAEVQKALLRVKATDMAYKFDTDGLIVGMKFGLDINGQSVGFILPINIEKVSLVLKKEGIGRCDRDYVYRVAWACMRDWVTAQMALIETEMAEPLQVFLPYAYDRSGKTLFEKVVENPTFLIGDGN